MQPNPSEERFQKKAEELKDKINTANLQFIVLLQLIIERIEFLEKNNYVYGSIKQFLKNSKVKYEKFVGLVFKEQGDINKDNALSITSKLFVMQERVELALLNQYILPVDVRKQRARAVLSKYMIQPMVDKAMVEMEEFNLFNF